MSVTTSPRADNLVRLVDDQTVNGRHYIGSEVAWNLVETAMGFMHLWTTGLTDEQARVQAQAILAHAGFSCHGPIADGAVPRAA